MNIISLSKGQFENLKPANIPKEIINTEANMLEFNYKNKKYLIKCLFNLLGPSFANKLYTIEMLSANKEYLPSEFVLPCDLISVRNEIKGFTIPELDMENLQIILKNPSIDAEEKIFYLKSVGEILNNMKTIRKYSPVHEFYINDLHEGNFMVNPKNKDIKVIDLDSAKIAGNQTFASKYLSPFSLAAQSESSKYVLTTGNNKIGYIRANEQTDLYCYNIMILNYLYGSNLNNMSIDEFYKYLTYLNDLKIDKELINIFENLLNNKPNQNPSNYLDTLTYTQIGKSNSHVYKLNCK